MNHSIDLGSLSRSQLKELALDISQELEGREHDERVALEDRLRAAVQEAGFDPADLQFRKEKARRKATKRAKGGSDEG